MSAPEKYRPKKLEDLIGNQKQLKDIVDLFLACQREGSIPKILIHGPVGCGKTTAARVLSQRFKLLLKETNASDARRKHELLDIIRYSRMRPFGRQFLIFLDEVDGITNWSLINTMLKKTNNPVILVANDQHKIPAYIKQKLTLIQFYQPWLNEVVEHLHGIQRLEKRELDFSSTTRDVRHSINALIYGGESYTGSSNPFDIVQDICLRHDLSSYNKSEHFIWLLDNVKYLYQGKELLDALEILALHEETGFDEVLKLLPTGKIDKEQEQTIQYPFYKRRLRVYWSKKKA